MRGNPEQQKLNFLGFSESFLGPAEADLEWALGRQKGSLSVACSRATLIEAAHWLSLGAAIGYFSKALSITAIRSIIFSPEVATREFLQEWGYILNPLVRSETESWLATPRSIGKEVLFGSEEAVRTLFDLQVGNAGRFSRDRMAQTFVILIDFFNRKDLNVNLIGTPVFLEDIGRVLESADAFDPETGEVRLAATYVGFSIWLNFLKEFRVTAEIIKGCDWIALSDARGLLRRVTQIQSWRLYGLTSDSLAAMDARATVNLAIARGYGLALDQAAELQDFVLKIITFWEHTSALTGGAGA